MPTLFGFMTLYIEIAKHPQGLAAFIKKIVMMLWMDFDYKKSM